MFLNQSELNILQKYSGNNVNVFSNDKLEEAFRIFDEILEGLDEYGIRELMGGGEKDIEEIWSIIFESIISTLYGNDPSLGDKLSYLDHVSEQVEEILSIENLTYFIISKMPNFQLNYHHLEWGDVVQRYNRFCIIAARDHGKCFNPNTKIRMFDGSIKPIKEIKIGDEVMGYDSTPRKVLSLHKGKDNMFRIKQSRSEDYEVNSKHIMTLYDKKDKKIINSEISDVLFNFRPGWQGKYRGLKYPIEYKSRKIDIDPYFIGLWLGDGCDNKITNIDFEIHNYLDKLSEKLGMKITKCKDNVDYCFSQKEGRKKGGNKILNVLRKYNIYKNKHIPNDYLYNSRKNRLKLLAGLIDSDGTKEVSSYSFTSFNEKLLNQVKDLCDSLGFATSLNKTYLKISGKGVEEIPIKIKRKKYTKPKHDGWTINDEDYKKTKGATILSSIDIEEIGEGEYVGFSCDKDNLFLLADGTLVHNSYFYSNAYLAWKLYRYKPYVNKFSRKDLSLSKRGFLFSFSQQQAVDLLEILKNTIEDYDGIRERLLPKSRNEGWGKTDITCANGARLTTKGFGSSVRGAHPGYIMVDDGLKDNVIYSKTQRQKSIEYFHAVIMNMIVPGGQVGVVGTPFHANDLYGDLKSKSGWHVREYPAIFPDGTILWRERWGFEELLEKRETQGNLIFSRENLVKPVTNESTIFPMDVIERSYVGMQSVNFVNNREAYKIKFDRVVTAIDFSISSNVGADYTVMITAGVDEKDDIYLMNITRFKGKKFSEQMAAMRNININFRPDVMVLEQNVFQQIFVHQGAEEGLPVVGHTTGTNKYDLKAGLPSVALLYEMGKIKCPRGNDFDKDMGDLLASELSSVTWTDKGLEGVGEHDDCAMSLWLLTIAAKKITTGFSFKFL